MKSTCRFTLQRNHSRQQRTTDNVKPGRQSTEKIAPVRGDETNGKGQRVSNPPTKGIMHGKVPYSAKGRHSEATVRIQQTPSEVSERVCVELDYPNRQ